jgi:hypothetical protein
VSRLSSVAEFIFIRPEVVFPFERVEAVFVIFEPEAVS